MKEKLLIIGSNGLLGQKAVSCFREAYQVTTAGIEGAPFVDHGLPYYSVDITNRSELVRLFDTLKPDIVFNAAAYTQVDRAEEEKELCYAVNVLGVENLAALCKQHSARLVHITTDYVFDGKKGNYTEEDKPNPLGYYGYTKFLGEVAVRESGCAHIIGRTAVLFGFGVKIQANFAMWAVDSLRAGKQIRVVDDQIGNPTIADNLASACKQLLEKGLLGLYHLAGREAVSRYHFTVAIARVFGFDEALITRIKSSDFPQKAPRPMNASLNVDKALRAGVNLLTVEESLLLLKEELIRSGYLHH